MADNTPLNAGSGGDTMSTDDVGAGVKVQRVKVQFGVDGTGTDVNAANPLPVNDAASIADNAAFVDGTSEVMPMGFIFDEVAGTALTENDVGAARINANRGQVGVIEDGATRARYATVTAANALKTDGSAVTQPTSNATTSVVGTGVEATAQRVTIASDSTGVLAVKQATAANLNAQVVGTVAHDGVAAGNPLLLGAYAKAAAPANVSADADIVRLWALLNGALAVNVTAAGALIGGDATGGLHAQGAIAHDSADSGNPVKVGGKAVIAFPTAVAANDRTNILTDLYGRPLTSHIPPEIQKWKGVTYSSTQTGTALLTPTSTYKLVVTHLVLGCGGTTAGRIIIWFGASADTTYTEGTDQVVCDVEMAPSATTRPGLVLCPPVPIFGITADHVLRITTDAGITVHVSVYGYERL